MASIILKQLIAMLIIMIVGVMTRKLKIITEQGNKELSNLLLLIVNPIVIFLAFQRDFSYELVNNLLAAFALSILSYIITIPLSHFFIGKNRPEYAVERFSTIYSNCGFFGIPIVMAVLGSEGVFYLTAYMAMFNIFVWTHGVLLMQNGRKLSKKEIIKNIANINVIASIGGLLCFIFQIRLIPEIQTGIEYIANMNTPLAMLIAGVTLSQMKFSQIIREKGIYLVSALKLVVYPMLMSVIFYFLPVEEIVKQTILIAIACPVGATVTLLALRFEKNAPYASMLYASTTIIALITMPFVLM